VDGSTRCGLGAEEPRRLATSSRGGGDAHAGRPRIRAVLVAPMHYDADSVRSSLHPICPATTAARAPQRELPPWRTGKSGAATPSAWRRAAAGGRR